MPIYEYKCNKCGNTFTELKKINDRKIPCESPCKECGEMEVEQQIQAPGFTDSIMIGLQKPSKGFQDVLNNIHRRSPGSTLNQTSKIVDVK